MSDFRIDQITNQAGTAGPDIAGITTFSGSSGLLMPSGNTFRRSVLDDVVQDGLVLYLDAGNDVSYPGSGTNWFDLSGNGNNGTLVNGVGYNSGNGGSLVFDGVNDFVNLDNLVPTLNILTYSTECYWFKLPSTPSEQNTAFMLSWFGENYNAVGNFTSESGSESISIHQPNIRGFYQNGHMFYNDNIWHYACYVYGSGFNKLYVDANELTLNYTLGNSSTTRSGYSASKFILGIRSSDGFGSNGNIASTKIYNRALTPQEIQQNYNAFEGRYT